MGCSPSTPAASDPAGNQVSPVSSCSASGESKEFKVYIAYHKGEAAQEALHVQSALETETGRKCCMGNRDGQDISDIADKVSRSECLMLVQSRGVLAQPEVLLELMAANSAAVPIVGVWVEGRAEIAFDFAEMADILNNLET